MKIVIDIDKLLQEGRVNSEEYTRLKSLAVEETGSLAFNILIGFGVIATAGGALALLPSGTTAIALGFALSAAGFFLSAKYAREWGLLGSMLLLVGFLTAAGGIAFLTKGSFVGFLTVTVLCLTASVLAKSSLLAAMSVLSLFATAGATTGYGHAMYMLAIRQPTLTVGLFSLLSLGSYFLSNVLSFVYQRLAIVFARTSLFVVNLGFWVGSLWGDSLWYQRDDDWGYRSGQVIPDWIFVIAWAVALAATGIWAARSNKRWVVNIVAVFAAIHFYTQFFERLGASPISTLIAGLVALGIAFGIVGYNKAAKAAANEKASPKKIARRPVRPLVFCGLVMLLLLMAFGLVYYCVDWITARKDRDDQRSVVILYAGLTFLEDIEHDRIDAAYQSTAASFQKRVGREEFETHARRYLEFMQHPGARSTGGDYKGPDEMIITESWEDEKGNSLRIWIKIVQEDSILYRRPPPPRVGEFTADIIDDPRRFP